MTTLPVWLRPLREKDIQMETTRAIGIVAQQRFSLANE